MYSQSAIEGLNSFRGLVQSAVKNAHNSSAPLEQGCNKQHIEVEEICSPNLEPTDHEAILNDDSARVSAIDDVKYFDESILNNAYTSDSQDAVAKAAGFFPAYSGIKFADFVTQGVNNILKVMGNSIRNRYIPSHEQLRVIYSMAPRLLIDSGPGTGKTATIVRKAFIEQNLFGLSGEDILAFTYTDAGKIAMNNRYSVLMNEFSADRYLEFKTIHAWCRRFVEVYTGEFKIITEGDPAVRMVWDSETEEMEEVTVTFPQLLSESMTLAGISTKDTTTKEIYDALSAVIERNITTEDEYRGIDSLVDFPVSLEQILAFKKIYKESKNDLGVLDYNDMLEDTRDILLQIKSGSFVFKNELQRLYYRFKSIYVDEFQDTTPLQSEIINLLVELNRDQNVRLTCICDMDQSIYAFRGADVRNVIEFANIYKDDGLDVIFLTQNRRSVQLIIDLANSVISKNKMRFPKKITGMPDQPKGGGSITAFIDLNNNVAKGIIQKALLAEWSKRDDHQDAQMNKFAIMYRNNNQLTPYIQFFIHHRIPFFTKIDDRRKINYPPHMSETMDILGLIDLLTAPANPELVTLYLHKIIAYMGKEEARKIGFELRENPKLLLGSILKRNTRYDKSYKKMVELRASMMDGVDSAESFLKMLTAQYREAYYNYIVKSKKRADNLEYVTEYLSAKQTIEYLRGRVEEDKSWLTTNSNNSLGVNLTTFSSAKGLEYKNTFILPVPNINKQQPRYEKLSDASYKLIEEEARRIFYVALTRSEENIVYFYEPMPNEPPTLESVCKNMFTKDIMDFLIEQGVSFAPKMQLLGK